MMGRIRTIKPEFFDDPDIGELSIAARLLFIGLWTLADKAGRLVDDHRRFKARLFPYDDAVKVEDLLVELHGKGMIRRYLPVESHDKLKYIWIPNFTRHQRPHPKEAESVIPKWTALSQTLPGKAVELNGRNAGIFGSLDSGSLDLRNGDMKHVAAAEVAAAEVAAAEVPTLSTIPKATNGRPSLLVGERVEASRKQKPVFMGTRFSVFDWQVRELEKTVGNDAFDVLGFLFELDSRHTQSGQIIPRDALWAWLQSQVLGEARRRGMGVVPMASDLSKAATRMMHSMARIEAEERAERLALGNGGDDDT